MKLEMDDDIMQRIKRELPEKIVLYDIVRVTKGFNPKNRVDHREYEYLLPLNVLRTQQQIDAGITEQAQLDRVRGLLQLYVGTHNFHNFTARVDPNDRSAQRFIKSFVASEPFELSGLHLTRLTVIGQSFMLHQIRKMIGFVVAIVRKTEPDSTGSELIASAFTKTQQHLPMAPGLGLYLNKPLFESYNKNYSEGRGSLAFTDKSEEIESFKMTRIYPSIVETNASENTFAKWCEVLDKHHSVFVDDAGKPHAAANAEDAEEAVEERE
jgi:tRNA pseudouridine38-40 synthase